MNRCKTLNFVEYDEIGTLIREFYHDVDFQAYCVIKYTFEGFWFANVQAAVLADSSPWRVLDAPSKGLRG